MNKSWAIPKHKLNQPNFDWTKPNSFQVKILVTEGNDVIPRIIEKAKAVIPKIKKDVSHQASLYSPSQKYLMFYHYLLIC